MLRSPGDIFISFGSINIYYYGLFIALAVISGFLTSSFVMKKYYRSEKTDTLLDLLFWVIPSGVVGARVYYVLLCFDYYSSNIFEIFMLQNGGLSIHGAIIGGIIGGYIFVKKHKISFLRYADIVSYGLPVAQAVGRWGNFFNSEAYGLPTNLPWAVYIPIEKRKIDYIDYSTYHPAFLYEAVFDIFIFLILYFVLRKVFKQKDGCIFFCYLILYSSLRLLTEYIRVDSVLNIFYIPVASWVSIFIIGISAGFLYFLCKKRED